MLKETVNYLGLRGKDKITGLEGVITSVCFDLYGCAQVALHPGLGKDGKIMDTNWFDVIRVEVNEGDRVLAVPAAFQTDGDPTRYEKGPAEKAPPKQ